MYVITAMFILGLIALLDFSYVVALADRGPHLVLLTAYCVEPYHSRCKLQREFEAYNKNQRRPT